jgi:hypothetical protein
VRIFEGFTEMLSETSAALRELGRDLEGVPLRGGPKPGSTLGGKLSKEKAARRNPEPSCLGPAMGTTVVWTRCVRRIAVLPRMALKPRCAVYLGMNRAAE